MAKALTPLLRLILVGVFFILLTLLVTYPLIFHLNTLIIDRFDGLLITWILNWDLHAIAAGFHDFHEWVNFFNANIFYPYKNTLAFSDYMIPQALLALPVVLVFKEPLLAYNLNFLFGFILTGVSLYYLVLSLTRDNKASLLVATLFTYSTIHLNYMTHLQLFNLWPVILAILFLITKHYKLYTLLLITAALTTVLDLYFILTIAALVFAFAQGRRRSVVAATGVGVIVLLPFLVPYLSVSHQFHYVRPINDAINFSLQLPDLVNISNINRFSTLFALSANTTPAYPGVTFMLFLVIIGFMLLRRFKLYKKSVNQLFLTKNLLIFTYLALVSFVLALGPALHLQRNTVHVGPLPGIPLPYIILYYLLPGFSAFRTPSRWIILTFLSLSLIIGLVLKGRISRTWVVVTVLAILAELQLPFKYATVPSVKSFPPEQKFLSTLNPDLPLIQFPIYNWSDLPKPGRPLTDSFAEETLREYYSTIHFHRMFNGFSGFSPTLWQKRVFYLQKNFPSNDSIEMLGTLKVRLVLVPSSWQNRLKPYNRLTLVKTFPVTALYELK